MRTIKANKAVQILADKIGVEVSPGYFTTALSSTYNYDYVTVASKIPGNDNYVIADHDNNAFVYNGETKTIGADTKYELVAVDDSTDKIYNNYADPLESQTLFEVTEDSWTPRTTVGSVCSVAGDAVYVDSDRVRTSLSDYIVNGSWLEDITYSYKRGIITGSSTVTSNEYFTLSSITDWENHPKFENGDHVLYADSDYVAVGTKLHFTKESDYNKQTVTSTSSSEYGIDCSMYYSVNAENWTEISGLERQNVINNIPRGEYLKFTQDVILTD